MNGLTENRLKDATIACLLIPHFALRVEMLRHPAWDGMPLAMANLAESNRRRLTDCSPEAASQGLRAGMLVREALSLCPDVTVVTADPVHYATVFARILRDLHDVSPLHLANELIARPALDDLDPRITGQLHTFRSRRQQRDDRVLVRVVPGGVARDGEDGAERPARAGVVDHVENSRHGAACFRVQTPWPSIGWSSSSMPRSRWKSSTARRHPSQQP